MIAAFVLAFVPMVWPVSPVPIQSKLPRRDRLPPIVSAMIGHNSTDHGVRGGRFDVESLIESGEGDPLPIQYYWSFTDSCGRSQVLVGTYTLEPYQGILTMAWIDIAPDACPGQGVIEHWVIAEGQLPYMNYLSCAWAGLPPGCRARVDIPVWVDQ